MSTLRLPQNPGIGGLEELTSAEETFLTGLAGITYSNGDILYASGGFLTNLGIGSEDQVLTSKSGIPSWEDGVTDETDPVFTAWESITPYLVSGDSISLLTNDAGYLTAESDTLQSVTDRGATTTNDITVSKSNPKLIVSDTATDSPKAWLEKLTTFDGAQLVSQGRRFAPANAISILGTAGTMANQPSLGAFFVSTWLWSDGSSFQSLCSNGTNNIQLRGQSVSPPYIRVAGFGGSTVDFFAVSGQPALVGRWTHVVVGRNGSGQWSVWYDGVASPQNGSSCGSTTHNSFTVPITTNGDVDETIIYNIAPTQSLVNGLYNSGVPTRITDYTNVVAHWSADQSSGTTLTDNSGNGRNITGITGATWITGIVSSNVLQSLTDIPILKIQNNGIAGSYGTLTHGWYETTRGTTNIYDGLSHQFNYLGTSKMTVGSGGVSLALADGTLAAPSLYFNNSTGTGIYSDSAGVMRHVTAGTLRLTVYSAAILASVPFYGQNGSAAAPTYSISADTNTGWYSGGADIINFSTGGVYRGQIDSAGRQAWGTTTSTAIFSRIQYAPTQVTTGTTVGQFEGTHTQNADNALGFVGSVSSVGLNTAGFNNTSSLSGGGGVSGYYALVQAQSTPATGTTTAISGFRTSVRNSGAATVDSALGFQVMSILNSGGGTINSAYGFYAGVIAAGTNNYSFYGVTTAATGRWNIYMAGSANNYMSGALNIGSTTVDSKFKVETSGSLVGVKIQGASGFTGDLTQWIDVASATVMASVDKLGVIDATSYKVGGAAGLSVTCYFDATTSGNVTSQTFVGGILTAVTTLP